MQLGRLAYCTKRDGNQGCVSWSGGGHTMQCHIAAQDIYERYWDLDTTFGKWNLDSAKKKMAHTKFLTVHFETGTIPPIYVLELVV